MVDFSEARLEGVIVHRVGNRMKDDGIQTARQPIELNDELRAVLEDFFLKPFKNDQFYRFNHPNQLSENLTYTYVTALFDSKRAGLLPHSESIAKHLYDVSIHPQIKAGELYVALFSGCQVQDMLVDAVGIFKSENKDIYLKIDAKDEAPSVHHEQGVNVRKLDKGALIFNTFGDDGFSLLTVDTNNKETQYWREDFLQIERLMDDSFHTASYIDMCYNFVEEVSAQDPETGRSDQLSFMNNSLGYFAKSKAFDPEEFRETALTDHPQLRDAFTEYQNEYETQHKLNGEEGFAISRRAVSEAKRRYKSQIKLDTGIDLKIDPRRDADMFIERGFDPKRQMGFYKVYFNSEE